MRHAGTFNRIAVAVAAVVIGVVAFTAAGQVFAADAGDAGDAVVIEEPRTVAADIEQPRLLIDAIDEALPSTVYIRDNAAIETELCDAETQDEMVAGTGSLNVVDARFTVIPSIIITVNSNDEITGFWNNTQPEDTFFCLKVKSTGGETSGHPLTPGIFTSFKDLFNALDRTVQGNIFPD